MLALETRLAASLVPFGAAVTPSAPLTLGQLRTALPGFDWQAWAAPQGFDRPVRIVFNQPSFFSVFAAVLPKASIETLKMWLLARFLTAAAPQLPRDFERLRFDFYGKVLTGQDAPRDRWKVGVALVTRHLGDALGRLYVEQHFPPRARATATTIVTSVLKAQRELIERADWLPRERARRGAAQARHDHAARRLSGDVARLLGPRDPPGRSDGQRAARAPVRQPRPDPAPRRRQPRASGRSRPSPSTRTTTTR